MTESGKTLVRKLHGNNKPILTLKEYQDRFWSRVKKTDGCWVWTGSKGGSNYGSFYMNGKHRIASRLVYEWQYGSIEAGMLVCHHCDNRLCVRPDHLFLGTNQDNQIDSVKKGRSHWGKKTHCPHGHEYTKENTRKYKNGRWCLKCSSIYGKKYWLKKSKQLKRIAELERQLAVAKEALEIAITALKAYGGTASPKQRGNTTQYSEAEEALADIRKLLGSEPLSLLTASEGSEIRGEK